MEALESNAIGRGRNEGTEIYLREVRMVSENYEEELAQEKRVTATLEACLDMEHAELKSLVSAEKKEAEAEEELQAQFQNLARESVEMADALALVSEPGSFPPGWTANEASERAPCGIQHYANNLNHLNVQ